MSCNWLEKYSSKDNDYTVYRIFALRKDFIVEDLIPNRSWLVRTQPALTDEDVEKYGYWMKFAVLDFYSETCGEENSLDAKMIFHGEGPANGSLRECRHTYWGEDGYLFYPQGESIIAAIKRLADFYDL